MRAGLAAVVIVTASCGRWNFADRDGAPGDGGTGDGDPAADAPPFIDSSMPCEYTCSVDLPARTTDCSGVVAVDVTPMMEATAVVDLTDSVELELSGEACDTAGYTIHVGDSPSNNGGGGDAAQFSNDAEVYVMDGALYLHGNDYGIGVLGTSAGIFPTAGCTSFELRVRDQLVEAKGVTTFSKVSPFALRLQPPVDDEGVPDAIWYIGLDRTHADALRNGVGLTIVTLCLR